MAYALALPMLDRERTKGSAIRRPEKGGERGQGDISDCDRPILTTIVEMAGGNNRRRRSGNRDMERIV
jgi:hypothetical protein